ncbi:hypothetical protein E2542_SST28073 [Spatholobus suberectus]|nr:hypothetical protein E2542_SST28073 [Spatholobus suberectus]
MQSDKEEKVEYSQEALHTAANVNLLHLEQGEVTWLFDNSDVLDDAGGYGGKDDTSSPQDSNRIDLNLLQVSHEEFGNPLVEEVHKLDDYVCVCEAAVYNDRNGRTEVNTRCLDNSIGAINNDGKTNVTVEQFIDEVHSSTFEDSDGTPVQFLPNDALSEVKNDINIHEMVFSDTSEAKFASSRKISLSPTSKRMIDFFPSS